MGKFRALVRLQLIEFFSKYRWGMGLRGNKQGKGYLFITLLLLTLPFLQMSVGVYHFFSRWGRPELAVVYMTVMTFLLMLFTAIPLLYSLLLYSGDYQILTPLPIAEDYLVLAKLSVVWVYMTGINLVLSLPVLILTRLEAGRGVFFLPGLFLGLLTPLPPLFLATLIVFGLINVGVNRRRKNRFSLFFAVALLGLVMGTQLLITGEKGLRLLVLTERLTRYYPPAAWAAQIVRGSWLNLFSYFLLTLLCLIGLKALGRRLYRSALLFSGAKPVKPKLDPDYRRRSKHRQLLRRNLLIISKQPVFLMNTLISLALPGLVLLAGFLSGDFTPEKLLAPEAKDRFTLLWVGLASAPALLTNLSATAITREGKAFWETKVLPVTPWDNLRARIGTTLLVNLTASLLVVVIFYCSFPFPLQWTVLFTGFFFVAMLTWFLASTDLVINIYRPFLDWSSPAAAIKNNLNVILSLAYRPFLAVIPFTVALCLPEAGLNRILFASGLVFFLLTLLVRRFLQTVMLERFKRIVG